jgi:hypothetical protein
MTNTTIREDLLFRRTRKGAENWIARTGYVPGARTEDSRWNGSRVVRVHVTFSIEKREDLFYVVRETEEG